MKLLIVEDESKINKALNQGFSEEGFAVDSVYDGEDALKSVELNLYDCIILDLMVPKIDGIRVIQEMRKMKNYTPVIILTAKDQVDDKIQGLEKGADDYLAKPFSFDELLARVKALIRRASTNENLLSADTLTLDPYKRIVKRGGKEIRMTGKDFGILEYLLKHKGAIVSETQIIDHVWDYDAEIASNVVASHMKSLRMKVDKAFPDQRPIIHTLRGLGYKIDG